MDGKKVPRTEKGQNKVFINLMIVLPAGFASQFAVKLLTFHIAGLCSK